MRKLLLSVVLLLGCGDPAGPDDLLYVTKVSPTVLRVGEQAIVTTTVANFSDEDVTIGAPGCLSVYLVTLEDGTPLLPKGPICAAARIANIARGQIVIFNETWKPAEARIYLVRTFAGFYGGVREGTPARVEVRP